MNLSNLKPAKGSIHRGKRLGRGEGSGKGGTCGKGHKGAKSRSGYKSKLGYEGGQMPLHRRVPKFGFKNFNRVEYKIFNLDTIQDFAKKNNLNVIDPDVLIQYGLIGQRADNKIKILARGAENFKIKLEIKAHSFSKRALNFIEEYEGKAIKI